ncbi:MAG TPA: class I SAM-dependent methyltransferase [Gemmatimonadales bacterium]|nr:class I SAM-dependent methyltransferase [Gemmatimonadales bacterium]
MNNSDRAWERWGAEDPYWGVLSSDQYRKENLDAAALERFWASGEAHVAGLLEQIHRHLDPGFAPRRVLDFGCGVGRLVVPFARRAETVVGMDVSESMRREARANCERMGVANVALVPSDDRLSALEGQFDLVHSYIVFQHIPTARGERILARLAERITPDGVGAIQLPYHRSAPALRRAVNWTRQRVPGANALVNAAQGRPVGTPLIQMNRYDLGRLYVMLERAGFDRIAALLTHAATYHSATLLFQRSGDRR